MDEILSTMEASAKVSADRQKQQTAKPQAIQSLESVLASLTAIASTVPSHLPPISSTPPSAPSHSVPAKNAPALSLTDSINKVARDIFKD